MHPNKNKNKKVNKYTPHLLASITLLGYAFPGGTQNMSACILIIIIIINLIYIAQFDTNGILTALYIVITYIQMQYVHV